MKKRIVCIFVITALSLFMFAACNSTENPDYSAIAGTYYQREGGTATGAIIESRYIALKADGTWELVDKINNDEPNNTHNSGTIKIDGNNITLIYGSLGVMRGTLNNGILTLEYWTIILGFKPIDGGSFFWTEATPH
jgi:uncharacterized protein with beta-barrel porin domain